MTIVLEKNKPFKINLDKRTPQLHVGLSWDESVVNGVAADCDCSVVMLGANNKIPAEAFFVYYHNLTSEDASVVHQGDNRDGAGEGDDEVIKVDLGKVRADIVQMLFIVSIHESTKHGHNFGNVHNASIRILKDSEVLCTYSMSEVAPESDAMIIGRMVRDGAEWNFEALGQCFDGGLGAVVELYT